MLKKAVLRILLLVLVATLLPAAPVCAKKDPLDAKIAELPEKYQKWLEEVALLLSKQEKDAFLLLAKDYQRDAFIERFWKVRDPYPGTARNEFEDMWKARVEQARQNYGSLQGDRSRMLLLNGPPDDRVEITHCTAVWPAEVWYYHKNERLPDDFLMLFYQHWGRGPYRLFEPGDGLQNLMRESMFQSNNRQALQDIQDSCRDSDALVAALSYMYSAGRLSYPMLLMKAETPVSRPAGEWLATFASYSTDLPDHAATFPATLSFSFPGRHQSRTVVQGLLKVKTADIGQADLGGARSWDLLLTGEVLANDKLFDRFRYKFDFPSTQVEGDTLPVIFQRYLRPGDYDFVLKLEDLDGHRFYRRLEHVDVPDRSGAPLPQPEDLPAPLAEADAAIAADRDTLKIVPPTGEMQVGKVRFDTLVTGTDVDHVVFAIDGAAVLTKGTPPWSVELDLGNLPRSQRLSATAYDQAGHALAHDSLLLNASAHRFRIHIDEPRPGQHFHDSLRLRAQVQAPEEQTVERVEVYLNETRVATLYQPPYDQPITLAKPDQLAYVRAVAYLPDGSSTDDQVFVNAPPGLEQIDVQMVELFASVKDRDGHPVPGLTAHDFKVLEDGAPQTLRRFDRVDDLPFHAAILLDTSASMKDRLADAQEAALTFFQKAITPRDRAALITFNDRPYLAQKFTNRLLDLGGALAGLKAERGTALYDSIVYGLYYFNGIKGQRALLVLTDGEDEGSRFTFDQAMEFARRAGVTLYTIGLDLGHGSFDVKRKLTKLADETGGRSFFVNESSQLTAVYRTIEEELRSQYFLAYQSNNPGSDGKFRTIEIKVDRSGVRADTMRGYYP